MTDYAMCIGFEEATGEVQLLSCSAEKISNGDFLYDIKTNGLFQVVREPVTPDQPFIVARDKLRGPYPSPRSGSFLVLWPAPEGKYASGEIQPDIEFYVGRLEDRPVYTETYEQTLGMD